MTPLQLLRLTPKPELTIVWSLGVLPHPSISHTANPHLYQSWLELPTAGPQARPPTGNCQESAEWHCSLWLPLALMVSPDQVLLLHMTVRQSVTTSTPTMRLHLLPSQV